MQFDNPLIPATILKRYKRFLADVELENGEVLTVHTPNTGSMTTCWGPGWPVQLSLSDNPKRKYQHTLEMTSNGETWIGINTSLPNKLAKEAIEQNLIQEFAMYDQISTEKKVGDSRIDILLTDSKKQISDCYIEVKNVTLLGENKRAIFPDAISKRAKKHIETLQNLAQQGYRTAMLYVIQRNDITSFSPARDIDPEYAEAVQYAADNGVELYAYEWNVNPKEIVIKGMIPVEL